MITNNMKHVLFLILGVVLLSYSFIKMDTTLGLTLMGIIAAFYSAIIVDNKLHSTK